MSPSISWSCSFPLRCAFSLDYSRRILTNGSRITHKNIGMNVLFLCTQRRRPISRIFIDHDDPRTTQLHFFSRLGASKNAPYIRAAVNYSGEGKHGEMCTKGAIATPYLLDWPQGPQPTNTRTREHYTSCTPSGILSGAYCQVLVLCILYAMLAGFALHIWTVE